MVSYKLVPSNRNSLETNIIPKVLDGMFDRQDDNLLLASIVDNLNTIIQRFLPPVSWISDCSVQAFGTTVVVSPGLVWVKGLVYVVQQQLTLPDTGDYAIVITNEGIATFIALAMYDVNDVSTCRLAIVSNGNARESRPEISVTNYIYEGDTVLG